MKKTYCGFVPFRSKADWWQNFTDIAETCIRCNQQYQAADMNGYLCRGCRHEIESAMIETVPDDWCEERKRVEAWLLARGL